MRTIETKGQFAKRKKRRPSAISNWIANGKITQAALIGEGNSARIWVEQAEADLVASLNPSQQIARPHPANARTSQFTPSTHLPSHADSFASMPYAARASTLASDREIDIARRAKADADRAEHEAEAGRRKLFVDDGRYVVAEDTARAWSREVSRLMSDIETFISQTLSHRIAERYGLDCKVLTAEMRECFRKFRGEISQARREEAAEITRLIQSADLMRCAESSPTIN